MRDVAGKTPAWKKFLGEPEKIAAGIEHPRAGDLIAVAAENAWFTYYYWLDDARAPDFARTVDIHRKPGYDPVELFLDPKIPLPKLKIAWRLLQKKLGLRMLMDVIPLDATLVKGSHGRRPAEKKTGRCSSPAQPEFLGSERRLNQRTFFKSCGGISGHSRRGIFLELKFKKRISSQGR